MSEENKKVEVVFSFDTTGSMYPCLTQVRRNINKTVNRLMKDIPNIHIGIIAHGDYCDAGSSYVTSKFEISDDEKAICEFVQKVGPTGGGDAPECYELVLKEAQEFAWTPDATKALVLIGDEVPHPVNETPGKIDWQVETGKLKDLGVAVHTVQALNRRHADSFYQQVADMSGGHHLSLDQFSYITDLFLAICYKQHSDIKLQDYCQEVKSQGRMNRGLRKVFSKLTDMDLAEDYGSSDLKAVSPGRFQILDVDKEIGIKAFAQENGLTFKVGRGFYEFTKTETIQGHKEIVLMEKNTGDLFEGEYARELLGLPVGETSRIRPTHLEKYTVFVQSTSANRKLMKNTKFLYEVEGWEHISTT